MLKDVERTLGKDMNFDTVEELDAVTTKINEALKSQKHLDMKQSAEDYKYKCIAIEHPIKEVQFKVKLDDILDPKDIWISQTDAKSNDFEIQFIKDASDEDKRVVYARWNPSNNLSEDNSDEDNYHHTYIGKFYHPNGNPDTFTTVRTENHLLIKPNDMLKVGDITIHDPFSFLDDGADILFKLKLEKMNDSLEQVELNMMLALQNELKNMILDYIIRHKDDGNKSKPSLLDTC